MATSSTKEKGTKQSSRSLASLLDKTGNNPSVTRSGARNEDREDDNSHASTDDEQSGGSGLSAVAADGEWQVHEGTIFYRWSVCSGRLNY